MGSGLISAAPKPLEWWLRLTGYRGITLPPWGIYVLPEHLDNVRLRRHELAHWEQARTYGVLGFYTRYLWFTLRYGYRQNPLEVLARKAEHEPANQD